MRIWLALAVFLTSHPLSAEPAGEPIPDLIPTRDLVRFCDWGDYIYWGEGYCHGYLDRMMESYECYQLYRFPTHPPALGYLELSALFQEYAEQHPETMDQPAAKTVSTVLAKTWPCP
jgi:hypothetical protein